jgi:hypothetical protein
MVAAVAVAVWPGLAAPEKIRNIKKTYNACTHLNEIAQSQMAFFLIPKYFGQRIHNKPIPHGSRSRKTSASTTESTGP